mgnify:CR=1 FL=1
MISLFCLLIISKTEIGKRIRNIRILNGLSQSELGEKLGLTADRIQKYENGARNPKVSMIFRIANALDVNAAALYDPTPCDDLSTMFFFFEMEEKYGMTIKKIVDDDGNVKYAVVANSEIVCMIIYLNGMMLIYVKKLKVIGRYARREEKNFRRLC